jgi:demethylmenaquinone methyltransferase / 2-methoxy-6-polyprenyl-1,4-benzoquinol methylase
VAAGSRGVEAGSGMAGAEEKVRYVRRMFGAIAPRYDLANTLISAGLHHRWKRAAIEMLGVPIGGHALDICCGTGDLAILLARRVGPGGRIVGIDFSEEMLAIARRRAAAAGVGTICRFAVGDAEALALPDRRFDVAAMGFGLRNVAHPDGALREVRRVLHPGGRLAILEFSRPHNWAVRGLYDIYSFTLLPWLGRIVSRHADAYLYLPTSIRTWPDQEGLAAEMVRAGFTPVRYRNILSGIAAIHTGTRTSAEPVPEGGEQ